MAEAARRHHTVFQTARCEDRRAVSHICELVRTRRSASSSASPHDCGTKGARRGLEADAGPGCSTMTCGWARPWAIPQGSVLYTFRFGRIIPASDYQLGAHVIDISSGNGPTTRGPSSSRTGSECPRGLFTPPEGELSGRYATRRAHLQNRETESWRLEGPEGGSKVRTTNGRRARSLKDHVIGRNEIPVPEQRHHPIRRRIKSRQIPRPVENPIVPPPSATRQYRERSAVSSTGTRSPSASPTATKPIRCLQADCEALGIVRSCYVAAHLSRVWYSWLSPATWRFRNAASP